MGAARKILIVDDDAVARHVAHTALKAAGFETLMASDAMSALSQTQRSHPDLILLDLGLPAGGGFTFLQRKRAIPAIDVIPVVVISGQDRATAEAKAMEAGASVYLEKPASGDVIVATVRGLFES